MSSRPRTNSLLALLPLTCRPTGTHSVRLIIGAQILPFIELMLLTWIQHSFEYTKKVAELQAAEDDKDQQLGVW